MLPQVNALPDTQMQPPFTDGNGQEALRQHGAHVGRHVVVSLGDVTEQGVSVRHGPGNKALEVPVNLGVCVLGDDERSAGVMDEQIAHTIADFPDVRLQLPAQFIETPTCGFTFNEMLPDHCPVSRITTAQLPAGYYNHTLMGVRDDTVFLKPRRKSTAVRVGKVVIGGDAPIVVQSMIDVPTREITRAAAQAASLARAGSEIVRVTVNDGDAARAVPKIAENLEALGIDVPLVGDFHFNGYTLLERYPECGAALAKLRINPGNIGRGELRDSHFARMVECACRLDKPVRIGVNWGSLDQDLLARRLDDNAARRSPKSLQQVTREVLVESALVSSRRAEEIGLAHDRIVVSCKLSDVGEVVQVYRRLAEVCDYPLHIGLTEAGMGRKGTVSSTSALAILLAEGIGDTIRVSLTPEPAADRTEEVKIAREVLQSLKIRAFSPEVVACPGCGRTDSTYFRELASEIRGYLDERMPHWQQQHPGAKNMTVAVMGCVVNGPGESRHANVGISLPGSGEKPVAPVYIDGRKTVTLKGATIADDFKNLVEDYVNSHY